LPKRKYISEEIDNMIAWLEISRSQQWTEVDSRQIGKDVLTAIKDIDLVAYVRFASVYNSFETPEDFQKLLNS
jgi:transcriptional repressor NrdR